MKKAVLSVMLITAFAKLLGFAREVVLSYFIGATGLSDAYLISLTIPGTIFQFVGTGLATCFIPIYLNVKKYKGEKTANTFTNTIIVLILGFSTIAIAFIWLWGDVAVQIFASGFTGKTFEYAVQFTKINILGLYVSTYIYVFNSLLQSNDYFRVTAFAAIPNSLLIIISIMLSAKVNILFLPIGSVVALLVQTFFLLPSVSKCGFKVDRKVQFHSEEMKELYRLMLPVIIGVSVNEINVLVDKTVASNVAEGGISALAYGYSLIMFVQGIFAQTIATMYYPKITRLAEANVKEDLKNTIDEAIGGILYLLLPITFGCILLSQNVVAILYGRGAFDQTAIQLTTAALSGYAIGTVGYGIREVLSRVFYAVHDTKTPTRNAMIGMFLNIFMNITFSRFWGVGGLALATSLSSIITSFLLLRDLRKKNVYFMDKQIGKMVLKLSVSVIIMSAGIMFIHNFFQYKSMYVELALATIVGGAIYLLSTYILKVDIIKSFFKGTNRGRKKGIYIIIFCVLAGALILWVFMGKGNNHGNSLESEILESRGRILIEENGFGQSSINVSKFRNAAVLTTDQGQVSAFFNEDGTACLALLANGEIHVIKINDSMTHSLLGDGHCSINLGYLDGKIFYAYGAHCTYGYWGVIGVNEFLSISEVKAHQFTETISYPAFYNLGEKLVLIYRNDSDNYWYSLEIQGDAINLEESSLILYGNTHEGLYINDIGISENGKYIAIPFVERYPIQDELVCNDGIYLLYRNEGEWENTAGVKLELPVSIDETEKVANIGLKENLMNQESTYVTNEGKVFFTRMSDDIEGIPQLYLEIYDIETGERATYQITNNHIHFDLLGKGTLRLPISRGQVVVSDDYVHVIYREDDNAIIASANRKGGMNLGQFEYCIIETNVGVWEPNYDIQLWLEERVLCVFIQSAFQGEADKLTKEEEPVPIYLYYVTEKKGY